MPETTPEPDAIERASASFRHPRTLDDLLAGVAPFPADDSFAIPDLADEEWDAFVKAINE